MIILEINRQDKILPGILKKMWKRWKHFASFGFFIPLILIKEILYEIKVTPNSENIYSNNKMD